MLAIYIGSFNPITNAHLAIARASLRYASKCIFVPTSDLYQKDSLKVKANDRLAMIQAAIADEPCLEVNPIEIMVAEKTQHQNKTIETLTMLQKAYHEDIAFIIGADNLISLDQWYRYRELLANFQTLIVPRDAHDVKAIIRDNATLNELLKNAIILEDIHLDISSKMVRERISLNEPVNELIHKNVKKYIDEHSLYRSEQ